jgi:hypothetical protein
LTALRHGDTLRRMKSIPHQLVDVEVVTDTIGIGPATVRCWAKDGRIPSVRISTRTLSFNLVIRNLGIPYSIQNRNRYVILGILPKLKIRTDPPAVQKRVPDTAPSSCFFRRE